MWHLVLMVFAAFGWQMFDDGPLANYIITALLVAFLCACRAWKSPVWPAYVYGATIAVLTAGCGGLYAVQADASHVLCDKGTSLPISIISGGLALLTAGYMMRRKKP